MAYFNFLPMERIRFGEPAATALRQEVERLQCERVFLLVSGSLKRESEHVDRIVDQLGPRFAGLFDKVPPFAPRDAVATAANQAMKLDADLIVTLGGGSVTDAGKIVQLCIQHNISNPDDLEPFRIVNKPDGTVIRPDYEGPTRVRQIAIPTTLSAAEVNSQGGSLDPRTGRKQSYLHPLMVPRVVIYDPETTLTTPIETFLSTGVRALDHCIETICAPAGNPFGNANAIQGLRLLGRGLPAVKRDTSDLQARLDCQLGAALSLIGLAGGIQLGISHALGRSLGALCGVPHGFTSCITLPPSMRFNRPACADALQVIARELGHPNDDAADVIENMVVQLGLPSRLSQVAVGPDRFEQLAEHVKNDPWLHTNPRKVQSQADIIGILESAA